MRSIIIGLSFIFFTLSAIVMFKALELPIKISSYQDSWQGTASESDDAIKNLIEEIENQDGDKEETVAAITDSAVTPLESKPAATEETIDGESTNIKTTDTENHPRTLTVFGGQTFRPGYDAISDTAAPKIEKLISEISVFPNSLVIIEGHTDNIPTGKLHKDNMDLSVRRARTIANILISRGIPQERISAVGYGDTRPIDTNSTEEGRARNRRVEVKLMLKEGEN